MAVKIHFVGAAVLGLLLLTLPAAAQVQAGNLNMNLSGTVAAGYSADYGNLINSAHSVNFGGSGNLAGSYYDPNFLSFTLSPYYNQSRANSNYQSVFDASGFDFTSGIFSGSHFPGSVSYSRSYNQQGSFGLPGVADLTTRGNSDNFGIHWSELLPGLPSLSVGFNDSNNQYSLFGTNQNGHTHQRGFNVSSGYRLLDFNLSAFFANSASVAEYPQLLATGTELLKSRAASNVYGFGVGHSLPWRGSFSTNLSRSQVDSDYLGYKFKGNIDTVNTSVGMQPTNKLHVQASANYTDNLAGTLYQSLIPLGGGVSDTNQSSHAWDFLGSLSYSLLTSLQTQVYASRRVQTFLGQTFGSNQIGGGVGYSRQWFGGSFNASAALTDNTFDHSNQNSLGLNSSVGFGRKVGPWSVSGNFGYAQNVQTLLVTYTSSYYNYSASIRRRFAERLTWGATAAGTHTGLTDRPGFGSGSQSFSTNLSYSRWIGASASYSKSNGQGLLSGSGIVPAPLPPPIAENLFVLYGAHSYSFSASTSPIRGLTVSAAFARSRTTTNDAGLTSSGQNEEYNTYIRYQFRKMYFTAGYARLSQGFSATGKPPAVVSSYFVGVSRWFSFF